MCIRDRGNRGDAMTDEPAFIRAVLDCPHDDTPRLVYADWLDEHGQPERAEFIRVQCAVARHDGYGSSDIERAINRGVADAFRRRERELWKSPEAGTWFGDDFYISIG